MRRATKEAVFFNRELSWLEFNERVLEEALSKSVPLLERLKFLAIVDSNFDEFFMVRVAGLKRLIAAKEAALDPSGMDPEGQLKAVSARAKEIVARQYDCLMREILPELAAKGLSIVRPGGYSRSQMRFLESYFGREVFPLLTPLRLEEGEEFPSTGNLMVHAAFLLKEKEGEGKSGTAVVQIPQTLERFVVLPAEGEGSAYALLDDIVLAFGQALFPGYSVAECMLFKVTRDADFGVDEDRDDDFVAAMEEVLVNRQSSFPVRLSVSADSDALKNCLRAALELAEDDVYELAGPIDIRGFMALANVKGFDKLRDEAWPPIMSPDLSEETSIWDEMRRRDILLHFPYESFDPVIRFIKEAAGDPEVLAIKMTLYRTGRDSPILRYLEEAARQGKQVTVLLELKARFDEEKNIEWATRLEQAGVIVVYGIARLKVHGKAALVIRREPDGMRRYAHFSTGNYNDKTAKLYSDLSFFTANEDLCYDLSLLFNSVTGYSSVQGFRRLYMAPFDLKDKLISMIDREAARGSQENPGLIMAKMNALADVDVIKALYAASRSGVRILLNIRGICQLVPGLKGLSDNIVVTSVVDRFLEHSRIFYFANGGTEEVWLSSADWMSRNLERRVEIMFPLVQEDLKQKAFEILKVYFRDDVKSHILLPWGKYKRKKPKEGGTAFRAQEFFYLQAKNRALALEREPKHELVVRRKLPRG